MTVTTRKTSFLCLLSWFSLCVSSSVFAADIEHFVHPNDTLPFRIAYAIKYAAAGDAAGAGLEMKSAAYIREKKLTRFHKREGKFGLGHVPGMITDDTWMSLALLESFMEHEHDGKITLSIEQIFASYRRAYDAETRFIQENGYLKPTEEKGKWWGGVEEVFKGTITFEEMRRSIQTRSGIGNQQPGNGSLMRAPCVGFLPNSDDVAALAKLDAEVTHPHAIAIDGSVALAMVLHHVVYHDKKPSDAIKLAARSVTSERVKKYLGKLDELEAYATNEALDLPDGVLAKICEDEKNTMLKSGGHGIPGKALYTLGAVLYVLKNHDDKTPLSRSLFRLLRMGGDVDSTASIGMAILGAYYGGTFSDDMASIGIPLHEIKPQEVIGNVARDYASFINKFL